VTDRIQIDLENHPAVQVAVQQYGNYIKDEVLATRLDLREVVDNGELLELLDEVSLQILVQKQD